VDLKGLVEGVKKICVVILLGALACCGHRHASVDFGPGHTEFARATEFELVIEENFEERRFELHVNSNTDRALCVSDASWPDSLGRLHFAAGRVHVTVDGSKYPIREHNLGICMSTDLYGCVVVIPPSGAIYGFIPFSEFDPEMSADSSAVRELSFEVAPMVCW
jgi:hypothetical protein